LKRGGIDVGMTVGSLSGLKSANKSSDIIVEEGIEPHRRTRLTMAQKKLKSEISQKMRDVPGFEEK